MANAFVIKEGSQSFPMRPVLCANEDTELQALLQNNHRLLVGEQINPADPRQWLLIKREMPVPDPNNGNDRWSIDFLFSDQDAIPTFVECKRFHDTRSRREVVAQMLEYAANGHHYWTSDSLKHAAQSSNTDLDAEVQRISADFDRNQENYVESYFQKIEDNLREGQIRLIFFLEQAPFELKSIVEFLNRQMERAEVLIIESQQFEDNNIKITVPMLFGYTEQARQIKKMVSISNSSAQKQPAPTIDELKSQALGSQELFDYALNSIRKVLGSPARTKTGVSYSAYAGDTKYSMLNIFPSLSTPEKGLAIGIYTDRLTSYFGINSDNIVNEIGHSDPSIPIDLKYRCPVYFAKDSKFIDKIAAFISKCIEK